MAWRPILLVTCGIRCQASHTTVNRPDSTQASVVSHVLLVLHADNAWKGMATMVDHSDSLCVQDRVPGFDIDPLGGDSPHQKTSPASSPASPLQTRCHSAITFRSPAWRSDSRSVRRWPPWRPGCARTRQRSYPRPLGSLVMADLPSSRNGCVCQ